MDGEITTGPWLGNRESIDSVLMDSNRFIMASDINLLKVLYTPRTQFFTVHSSVPVVTGFNGSATWNSMAGFGLYTEQYDEGKQLVGWKYTPKTDGILIQSWYLWANVVLTHATGFANPTTIQLAITRFNSGGTALNRNVIVQDDITLAGTAYYAGMATVATVLTNGDYFSVESLMTSAGAYNMYGLFFGGWRIR